MIENIVGKVYSSNHYGEFIVIERTNELKSNTHRLYVVEFLLSKNKYKYAKQDILTGSVTDTSEYRIGKYLGKTYNVDKVNEFKVTKQLNGIVTLKFTHYDLTATKTYKTVKTFKPKIHKAVHVSTEKITYFIGMRQFAKTIGCSVQAIDNAIRNGHRCKGYYISVESRIRSTSKK